MGHRNRFFLAAALMILARSSAEAQVGQHARFFEKEITRKVEANYLLYLPKDYGIQGKNWPLILYLHGGMGRGDDLEKVMWYPLPKMLSRNDTFPFVFIVPQCPAGEMWTDTELLISLLDEVLATYSIDPDRVYLAGYSMGGNGAWYLAYKHPERFAAVAPMSGQSNPWWATRLKDMPVWAFHGRKDATVPVSETLEMIESLRAKGNDVKVTIDPERGHSPPSAAEHEELFEWFLKHERERAPGR